MKQGSNVETMWREMLTNPDSPLYKKGRIFKHVPGDPRCRLCRIPLGGIAGPVLKLTGRRPARYNPHFCNACEVWSTEHPGGAEIQLSVLFADVRGSTALAEVMGPTTFAQLMRRFYKASNEVFVESDAFIDSPVGDEVRAFYFPVFTPNHAASAIRAAQNLMMATGYGTDEPWIPIGAGLHTGAAFVGTVGVEGTTKYELTALGDTVNVTGRLASLAGQGEILVSDEACVAAGLDVTNLNSRTVELRGRSAPLVVRVIGAA
ncbi:MAG: adenylate/guanylate cyclase domain-containing protein [Actinomycetota bacterium]